MVVAVVKCLTATIRAERVVDHCPTNGPVKDVATYCESLFRWASGRGQRPKHPSGKGLEILRRSCISDPLLSFGPALSFSSLSWPPLTFSCLSFLSLHERMEEISGVMSGAVNARARELLADPTPAFMSCGEATCRNRRRVQVPRWPSRGTAGRSFLTVSRNWRRCVFLPPLSLHFRGLGLPRCEDTGVVEMALRLTVTLGGGKLPKQCGIPSRSCRWR